MFAATDFPSFSFAASIGVPFAVVALSVWAIWRADHIVHRLFPDAAWERNLGWLNIRAEKRAARALRWFGYGIVILLVDSLFGIYWAATGLPEYADWANPAMLVDLIVRLAVLALCLTIWGIYFGFDLLPRLRAEREEAEHKRFLAEFDSDEKRSSPARPRRYSPLLQKTRMSAGMPDPAPKRRWNLPGG
jgi:hypothetical protein